MKVLIVSWFLGRLGPIVEEELRERGYEVILVNKPFHLKTVLEKFLPDILLTSTLDISRTWLPDSVSDMTDTTMFPTLLAELHAQAARSVAFRTILLRHANQQGVFQRWRWDSPSIWDYVYTKFYGDETEPDTEDMNNLVLAVERATYR